ncbi:MAG TPA: DUF5668 domain-containing protein [Acidobacteriota bacterium]|nr:DUF5668 domain-containing protein [Acidobacteriota bacterium]
MSEYSRSGALTAGLILIALGAIFLAENFYAPFSAWHLIVRYWPVILIIIGVKRLFCYFTWPAIPPATDKIPPKG